MKIYPMPTQCPACQHLLHVAAMSCPECGTRVEGEFSANEFALLPAEHLEFLRLYIKVRGNLKEVERVLGVSYPTVRAKMDAMLKTLGYEVQEDPAEEERQMVLSQLERGEITPAEATERLRALRKR